MELQVLKRQQRYPQMQACYLNKSLGILYKDKTMDTLGYLTLGQFVSSSG